MRRTAPSTINVTVPAERPAVESGKVYSQPASGAMNVFPINHCGDISTDVLLQVRRSHRDPDTLLPRNETID